MFPSAVSLIEPAPALMSVPSPCMTDSGRPGPTRCRRAPALRVTSPSLVTRSLLTRIASPALERQLDHAAHRRDRRSASCTSIVTARVEIGLATRAQDVGEADEQRPHPRSGPRDRRAACRPCPDGAATSTAPANPSDRLPDTSTNPPSPPSAPPRAESAPAKRVSPSDHATIVPPFPRDERIGADDRAGFYRRTRRLWHAAALHATARRAPIPPPGVARDVDATSR